MCRNPKPKKKNQESKIRINIEWKIFEKFLSKKLSKAPLNELSPYFNNPPWPILKAIPLLFLRGYDFTLVKC